MIDHFTLTVSSLARSRAFYEQALAPLGYTVRMEFEGLVGIGDRQKPYLWLKEGSNGSVQAPMHIAFVAKTRRSVDDFHTAALAAGAKDNGQPGLRPDYHKTYYAAFIIDPDGHPIEAVNHAAAPAAGKRAAAKKPARKAAAKKPARKVAAKRPQAKKAGAGRKRR